ncbi:MAG: DUF1800 domain-containing protein [Nocardioidaceae bacterium]
MLDNGINAAMPVEATGLSRRGLIARGAAVGALAVAGPAFGAVSDTASATALRYRVRPYRKTAVPSAGLRHMLDRFSYGITPGLIAQAHRAGGAQDWFEQQLNPGRISDRTAAAVKAWYPHLSWTPGALWSAYRDGHLKSGDVAHDFAHWVILQRFFTQRQLLETMTEFWSTLLYIPGLIGYTWPTRMRYDATIRANALGRFDNLLKAAVLHPCMLTYLDNAESRSPIPNENLGRELLELHTVGRIYSEADVLGSSQILSGWQVDLFHTFKPVYRESAHCETSVPVGVLGFSSANQSADGRALCESYLEYLAHHPATAMRLATRLATVFVSDTPSAQLVNHLASVYSASGTDIKAVLRALVASREFRVSIGTKVRNPAMDVVATYRALGVRVRRPRSASSAANQMAWQAKAMGQRPYAWPRPDGDPLDNGSWSSPGRLLGSFTLHTEMAGGWFPRADIVYRSHASWIPTWGMRFDMLVDHLCRVLLSRPSTPRLLQAACQSTQVAPSDRITRTHAVASWKMPRLLATILDTPEFMTR